VEIGMQEDGEKWRRWWRPDAMLTLVALGTGICGALLGGKYLSARAAAAEAEVASRYETTQVVVAAADVARGDVLDNGNLSLRKVPRDFLPPDAVAAAQAGDLLGRRAAVDIGRGTPIVRAVLASSARAPGLSSVLAPNERALTVAVDDLSSQAGGLRAGDRIDLYYGRRESGDAVVVPLLQQVEIMAVGDSFARAGFEGEPSGHYATVTLRVAAVEAPRVLLAQQAGELSVLLRAPGDELLQPVAIRSSRELLQAPAVARSAAPGIELLTGGTGELVPGRTWLRVGAGTRGDAT
jgi:pilus assembly protein CpaB